MGVWYATREDVKSALDFKQTARSDAQVDRAIESSSRSVEGCLKRRFYPTVGTRYKDWPNQQGTYGWRLWLDADEVVSLTALTAGGVAIAASDYFLEPANSGPPYNRLEIDLGSNASFGTGATHQRAIALAGVFDWPETPEPAGALAEALDGTETAVDVTDSAAIGVGHIIRADDERMIVTGKQMLTTGQTGSLTSATNDVSLAVANGAAFAVGETLLLDSERVLVVDIAGNTLTVKRAYDGSVLATHTGATIYAPRTLVVQRGALGTTAATHLTAAPLVRHAVPGLVKDLCVAKAINQVLQEGAGYARVSGSGDNQKEYTGRGIAQIEKDARAVFERKLRQRAV